MLKLSRNGVQSHFFTSNFRWVFGYTTSATNAGSSAPMADYLVNSLGFSKEEAIVASSKVRSFKSIGNPISVVDFLKSCGFEYTHIKKILVSEPRLLSSNVDKTLRPKFEAFEELGISGSELVDVISACPHVCRQGINSNIVPSIGLLRSIFGDDTKVLVSTIKSSPWLLAPTVVHNIPLNFALLRSYGLSADQIKMLLIRKSRFLVFDGKWLRAVLARVEEKFGIPRGTNMFFHGIVAVSSLSEETLELKIRTYKRFGWTEADIFTLVRKNPLVLVSSEAKIKSVLGFLMKELGYKPAEIVHNLFLLMLSLQKRIIPRCAIMKVLKEMGLIKKGYSLVTALKLKETDFLKKFVLPFKDKVPDLYDNYVQTVCPPLEASK